MANELRVRKGLMVNFLDKIFQDLLISDDGQRPLMILTDQEETSTQRLEIDLQ